MDQHTRLVALSCKGFLDEEEGLRLHELARAHAHLGPILEIGSYCGKSSVYLGSGAKAAGGVLFCLDHHRGSEENQRGELYHDPEVFDAAAERVDTLPFLRETIRRADLEDVAIPVVARSGTFARFWSASLGMVFIDGGHTFEAAHTDFESWSPKIAAAASSPSTISSPIRTKAGRRRSKFTAAPLRPALSTSCRRRRPSASCDADRRSDDR